MITDKIPDLTFLSKDHPEANGRESIAGEVAYSLHFLLENDKILCIKIGSTDYKLFADFIRQIATDDLIDSVLKDK